MPTGRFFLSESSNKKGINCEVRNRHCTVLEDHPPEAFGIKLVAGLSYVESAEPRHNRGFSVFRGDNYEDHHMERQRAEGMHGEGMEGVLSPG